MRADTDGQPITNNQFTTLANTPPDFLILRNMVKQRYGHDALDYDFACFNYSQDSVPTKKVLKKPRQPEREAECNLEGEFPYVICIMMLACNKYGMEIEGWIFLALTNYLVSFGITKEQFGIKTNGTSSIQN